MDNKNKLFEIADTQLEKNKTKNFDISEKTLGKMPMTGIEPAFCKQR